MAGILQPLIRTNVALLIQKIALLDLLVARYGSQASDKFATVCPLVGASIGQHYRHSMDHIELAALVASSVGNDASSPIVGELHYDMRVRGGTLEKDMSLSRQRLVDVIDVFQSLQLHAEGEKLMTSPIDAYFNLSADSGAEIALPSTIGRELGFAAHHAIHHMAMVKVIAVQTLGLKEGELPHGFGRAPSTLIFDKNQN
mmetsp:Transcript_2329/g.3592  ORF Transcript_2329/g.3592 Transcript_2329/m.3592 type:complete len:200 (-) Transcript_2329:590-1189(-)